MHVKLFPNFTSIIIIHINIIGDHYAHNHGFFACTLYQISMCNQMVTSEIRE